MTDAAPRVSDEDLQLVYSSSVRLWGRLPVSRLAEEISDANDKIKALEAERDGERERYDEMQELAEMWSGRADRAEAALARAGEVTEKLIAALKPFAGKVPHADASLYELLAIPTTKTDLRIAAEALEAALAARNKPEAEKSEVKG